ncbi:unknown [Feldmannia species virus]|uniref:Uncharacterized protein n=1 Tax=Feldmannia species virus TaxID=39420 RepID=B5LW94_9PHYC|nr:hypothetical protein FeldSpV_gp005 [Feldmannia species virus]ACH46757.1 unknown [Feldmannia species virus]
MFVQNRPQIDPHVSHYHPPPHFNMDSIIVDRGTGQIGASSLVKLIVPSVSDSTVWRIIEKTLQHSAVPKRHLRKARMLTFDEAVYVVDHVRFYRSSEWRAAHAETFKSSLRLHVEANTSPLTSDGGAGSAPQTKASVVRNCLKSINIDGRIRVDEDTCLVSLIDVVKIICPDMCGDYAKITLGRLIKKMRWLSNRVKLTKINGRGHVTPMSDVRTIVKLIWLLPGQASRELRRTAAESMCRIIGGDLRLQATINKNYLEWTSAPELEKVRQDLIAPLEHFELYKKRSGHEAVIRDKLAESLGGKTEVRTPCGRIDVLTSTEVIEVKHYRMFLHGYGQVMGYGEYHPLLKKRLHLFALIEDVRSDRKIEDLDRKIEMAEKMCVTSNIEVTFELV